MKKAPLLLLAVALWGCSISSLYTRDREEKEAKFSSLEITLSDMSKKITGYYGELEQPIPLNFDERAFIVILEKIYPDREKVEKIKEEYRIKSRAVSHGYSVVMCDRDSGNKLLEDFSCTLSKVDIRYWDKDGNVACEFEDDWRKYCE